MCFIICSNLGANQPKSNKKHSQSNCCLSQLADLFVGAEKKKNKKKLTKYKIKLGFSQKALEPTQDWYREEAWECLAAEQLMFILSLKGVDRYPGRT